MREIVKPEQGKNGMLVWPGHEGKSVKTNTGQNDSDQTKTSGQTGYKYGRQRQVTGEESDLKKQGNTDHKQANQ